MPQTKYLVTGATGHFGRIVVEALINDFKVAPTDVIAATRKPEAVESGAEARFADFDDPASLAAAFKGADRLLLVSTDALIGGKRLIQHQNAVQAAKEAGVKHIYYTSMPEPETSLILFAPDHLGTENAIKATGLQYTILRNNWYAENLLYSVPGALQSGSWYSSAGQGKTAFIPRADLAYASAAALVKGEELSGKTLTLSGGEALTNETIAAWISEAVGKPLAVVHVPNQAIVDGMVAHGFPEPVAKILASFDTATAAGQLATVTPDFETLTGRPPTPFQTWLNENVSLFTTP